MLLLMLALSTPGQAATGFAGLEWRPLSRADLVWVDDGRDTGTAVGEFDGTVRPLLSAFGGVWFNRYVGLSAGLGVARLTSTSEAADVFRQRHWGVVRPSLDVRIGWVEPRVRYPVPWFLIGVHGDIPSARDVSNGFTADEQTAADGAAEVERYRLGGIGGRVGAAVEYRLLPGISIGAQVTLGLHRTFVTGSELTLTSVWLATEAAILLQFEWPAGALKARQGTDEGPDGVAHRKGRGPTR